MRARLRAKTLLFLGWNDTSLGVGGSRWAVVAMDLCVGAWKDRSGAWRLAR
jgi:hypothetical protein